MDEKKENFTVYFQCVSDGSKLRVRIISPGYNTEANCQFPKNIRSEGSYYSAPASAIKFSKASSTKFFYRVSKKFITILNLPLTTNSFSSDSANNQHTKINRIFESDTSICVVCLCNEKEVVIGPCGHYVMCSICAETISMSSTPLCPMCRGFIGQIVPREHIMI